MQATYMAYRVVRGWIDDPQGAAVAFENGRNVIGIERSLGLFFEPRSSTRSARRASSAISPRGSTSTRR